MRVRLRRAVAAGVLAAATGGCFFPPVGPADLSPQPAPRPLAAPDATIVYGLEPWAGEDYVVVVGDRPLELARAVAPHLPMADPVVEETDVLRDFESVPAAMVSEFAGSRLATRSGGAWELRIRTASLREALRVHDVDAFRVTVCYPTVRAERLPALRRVQTLDCGRFGTTWHFDAADEPFEIVVRLLPRRGAWTLFVALVAVWFALWSVIAFVAGLTLRRDLPRTGGGMVAIATLLSVPGAAFAFGGVALIGTLAGPADNLALIRGLDGDEWVMAGVLPGLMTVMPVLVLLVTLVWGFPWRRGRDWRRAQQTPLPPPPPPAMPGFPPMPPTFPQS